MQAGVPDAISSLIKAGMKVGLLLTNELQRLQLGMHTIVGRPANHICTGHLVLQHHSCRPACKCMTPAKAAPQKLWSKDVANMAKQPVS